MRNVQVLELNSLLDHPVDAVCMLGERIIWAHYAAGTIEIGGFSQIHAIQSDEQPLACFPSPLGEAVILVGSNSIWEVSESGAMEAGRIPAGIECADLAGDLLAVYTGAGHLSLLQCLGEEGAGWDELIDAPVHTMEATQVAVSIGWGSSETQFKGPGARAKEREAKQADEIEGEKKLQNTSTLPSISWRADGQCFALNVPSLRRLMIFDRLGQLEHQASDFDANKITWHSHHLVSCCSKERIFFHERNSLYKEEFKTPFSASNLLWNPNGSLLASLDEEGKLTIWSTLNYHWYAQCQLRGEQAWWIGNHDLIVVDGDQTKRISLTRSFTTNGKSSVAVVDGLGVSISHYDRGIIPPPLGHVEVKLLAIPSALCLAEDGVWTGSLDGKIHHSGVEVADLGLTIQRLTMHAGKIYAQTEQGVTCLSKTEHGGSLISNHNMGRRLVGQAVLTDEGEVLDLEGNHLCHYHGQVEMVLTELGHVSVQGNQLYLNDQLISDSCLSYLTSPSLIMWTDGHRLHFHGHPEGGRPVEAGARLVCRVGSSLVLLMPRGNLETVHPHLLLMQELQEMVNRLDYEAAYGLARRHRLELSTIYTLNMPLFQVHRFLEQVNRPDYLSLFLVSLFKAKHLDLV